MKTIKRILLCLLTAASLNACIERYYSDFETHFTPQLVIDANLCPDEGVQHVVISTTSATEDPSFTPLSGCTVQVEDDQGNLFSFYEIGQTGRYQTRFDGSQVVIGNKYRLLVTTPGGQQYRSPFEQLLPSPPIDSLYFALETKPTGDPGTSLNGLQFYMNFKADDSYGPYYRLELVETYEYHAEYPLQKWQEEYGAIHNLEYPDYSNSVCYKTTILPNIFNLSTQSFSQNSYPHFKLHFVKDQSPPLKIQYSLLVNQYSLDRKAFLYWETLRKNNQEATDLFGKQPAMIKGNMTNVNDSTDTALGYFSVSTVQSRRITLRPMEGLSFDKAYVCKAKKLFGPVPRRMLTYFAVDYDEEGQRYEGVVGGECIFCQLLGGVTEKPSYWDEP